MTWCMRVSRSLDNPPALIACSLPVTLSSFDGIGRWWTFASSPAPIAADPDDIFASSAPPPSAATPRKLLRSIRTPPALGRASRHGCQVLGETIEALVHAVLDPGLERRVASLLRWIENRL